MEMGKKGDMIDFILILKQNIHLTNMFFLLINRF